MFPLVPFHSLFPVFEELYLDPSGEVCLKGLICENLLLRGTRECKREGGKSIIKVIFC